jgi:hypothetical protein
VSAPSPDQQQIRFVTVDGVRLRTSVRGQGPPLLLITGLGASLDLAEPVERELITSGCGGSRSPPPAPAPAAYQGRRVSC